MDKKIYFVGLVGLGSVLGGALSSWIVSTGQAFATDQSAGTVIAREFLLKGDEGNIRGAFLLSSNDIPSLDLYDRTGKRRATMTLLPDDRPLIRLFDGDGHSRAELSLGANGEPGLGLSDWNGRGGVWVYVSREGERGLGLLDRSGRIRSEFALDSEGEPDLISFRHDGRRVKPKP